MSIKLLARELYRCQQEVEQLERQLSALPFHKQALVAEELRKAKIEQNRLRRALDGRIGR